ncbi:MAG: hypothetical protein ACFCGT_25325 [Sandaracinaceae bacterium]
MAAGALLLVAALLGTGCSAWRADLDRAGRSYASARFEEARAVLVDLETKIEALSSADRARFYYLRGMTAYRLRQRSDALHYLAVAWEVSRGGEQGLTAEQARILERTLAEVTPTGRTHRPPAPTGTVEATATGADVPPL